MIDPRAANEEYIDTVTTWVRCYSNIVPKLIGLFVYILIGTAIFLEFPKGLERGSSTRASVRKAASPGLGVFCMPCISSEVMARRWGTI